MPRASWQQTGCLTPPTPPQPPGKGQRQEQGRSIREAAAHPEAACGWRSLRGHLARCRPHSAWSPLPTGLPRAAPPASGAQLKCPLLGEPSPTSRPSVTPSLTPLWFIFLHALITLQNSHTRSFINLLILRQPQGGRQPGDGDLACLGLC